MIAFAGSAAVLYIGRVLQGLSHGSYSVVIPVFLQEIAPPERASFFGFITQIGMASGFLATTLFGLAGSSRAAALLCCVPPFVCSVAVCFIRSERAEQRSLTLGQAWRLRKGIAVMVALMAMLQLSGINVVVSNLESLIRDSGLGWSAAAVAIAANCMQLFATFVAMCVVDRLGQPLCWNVSAAAQLAAFVLMALQQLLNWDGALFLIALFVEQLGYGVGIGPVPFALSAQLFAQPTVAAVMPIGTVANWALCAAVTVVWPVIQSAIGLGWGFLSFAGALLIALLFGVFVIRKLKLPVDGGNDAEHNPETVGNSEV
jgi:MFS family permease